MTDKAKSQKKAELPTTSQDGVLQGIPLNMQPPQAPLTLWKKSNRPVTLSIPSHWHDNPNCGEYLTTLDEDDPRQSRIVALALAGKCLSGKTCVNKRFQVIGVTMKPYVKAPDEQGEVEGDIGVIYHTLKESVFCGNYHAEADLLALTGRLGVPTIQKPVEIIIDPVPEGKTYRALCGDLIDQ